MSRKLYIKTFGCQMNERDSEIIEQLLAQEQYAAIDCIEDADLVLVNTCSIRAKAEQKAFSLLGQIRDQKERHPSLIVGVIGCVAQQEGERLLERMPHVDLIVGPQQIYRLPEMLDRLICRLSNKEIAVDQDANQPIPPFQKLLLHAAPSPVGFKRFVTIMQGCNNFCSYCVVPGTRGREISRPVQDILEEVRILVDQGVKEVTLLGQNVNSYGLTNQVAETEISFPRLLHEIAAIPGLQRLRFTTSHPKDLSEELMRCFGEIDILCPHFHLPVQSGSNQILQRMNRRYTVETYLDKVATLQRIRPDIALATDIIVGFPGETDEDFQATMALLTTVRFHSSFSFKYSDRPHTRSADLIDKVPEELKGERLAAFQALQDTISLQRNQELLGKNVEVMVEARHETGCKGRTQTNHIVHFAATDCTPVPGDLFQIRINHAGKHSLRGEITKQL